jgi:hypothetical protein
MLSYHDNEDQLIGDSMYNLKIEFKLKDAIALCLVLSYPALSRTGKTKNVRLYQNEGHAIQKTEQFAYNIAQ